MVRRGTRAYPRTTVEQVDPPRQRGRDVARSPFPLSNATSWVLFTALVGVVAYVVSRDVVMAVWLMIVFAGFGIWTAYRTRR